MKRLPASAALLALPFAALTACGPSGNDPGPGGVTVDEAKALDEAAEMIEAQRLPAEALPQENPPQENLPDELQADAPVELPPQNAPETNENQTEDQ